MLFRLFVTTVLLLGPIALIVLGWRALRRPLPVDSPISERRDRQVRRGLLVTTLLLAFGGVIPFAGLPGMGWLEVADPIARTLCTPRSLASFASNASWPAALVITLLWPSSFGLAYGLTRPGRSAGAVLGRALLGVVGVAAFGTLLAVLLMVVDCDWR